MPPFIRYENQLSLPCAASDDSNPIRKKEWSESLNSLLSRLTVLETLVNPKIEILKNLSVPVITATYNKFDGAVITGTGQGFGVKESSTVGDKVMNIYRINEYISFSLNGSMSSPKMQTIIAGEKIAGKDKRTTINGISYYSSLSDPTAEPGIIYWYYCVQYNIASNTSGIDYPYALTVFKAYFPF